jgi:hypothetical protein
MGAGGAQAGNGNLLYLSQEADPVSAESNSFSSDQTLANYSAIGTVWTPALQQGHGNAASVVIKSDCAAVADPCGTLLLTQKNSVGTVIDAVPGLGALLATMPGNSADVSILGEGNASILQLGANNSAGLTLDDGLGAITQVGLNNSAHLDLVGTSNGSIAQTGASNAADLTVTTVGNGSVVLNQFGANQSYGPITVATTSTVVITQFGF